MEVRVRDESSPTGWVWERFTGERLLLSPDESGTLWVTHEASPVAGIEVLRASAPGQWAEIRPARVHG